MTVKLGNNIASLRGIRQLDSTTSALGAVFERLSTGQRINKASDDAAGLAIAESLNASSRVFAQGIRNINDGISLLSIYEGALQNLSEIVIRQHELAEQAANGVYTDTQRVALDNEAQALADEYNRILGSVSFNGLTLGTDPNSSYRIQAGYGVDGSVNLTLATEIGRTVGTGNFDATELSGGEGATDVAVADFDNDGNLDAVWTAQNTNRLRTWLGNGAGGFSHGSDTSVGDTPNAVEVADFDGDNNVDIAVSDSTDGTIRILLGDGDGTFQAPTSFAANTPTELLQGDFNGDNIIDLISSSDGNNTISVFLGNGNGTFQSAVTTSLAADPEHMAIGDLNNDGILDVAVTSDGASDTVNLYLGNGSGGFSLSQSFSSGSSDTGGVAIGDIDGDGKADIAFSGRNLGVTYFSVAKGNGDGTAAAATSVFTAATDGPGRIKLADLTGDGNLDLIGTFSGAGLIITGVGKGDGTYEDPLTHSASTITSGVDVGDFNKDGGLDIVTANLSGSGRTLLTAQTTDTTSQVQFSIRTQARALSAMSVLENNLTQISAELGAVGATQSRLTTALNNLDTARENFTAAASRIQDTDVAEESSHYVRLSILQQSASAVLAQANQQPILATQLLQ